MEALAAKTAGELALQGSGWAVAVLLGIWSFFLFGRLDAANKVIVEMLKSSITVASASETAATRNADALKGVQDAISTGTRATEALAREQEGELREVRHAIANQSSVMQAIFDAIKRTGSRGGE